MKKEIIDLLKNILEDSTINEETSKENCSNWDSLRHLSVVVEIESVFDVILEPEDIEQMKSVKDIERILVEKKNLR